MVKAFALLGLVLWSLGKAEAQPTLDDAAWLAGHWRTTDGAQGFSEELWLPPAGGVMTGLFRYVGPDGFRVAELLLLTEQAGGPILRFKHFNGDYSTWEGEGPPVTLKLTEAGAERLVFADPDAETGGVERIIYARQPDKLLRVSISLKAEGAFDVLFERIGD